MHSDAETLDASPQHCHRLPVTVQDISFEGITLLSSRVLRRDSKISLDIQGRPRGTMPLPFVRVMQASMQADGTWLVDCEFVTRPTEEQIWDLL
jgi:hypothetical protein